MASRMVCVFFRSRAKALQVPGPPSVIKGRCGRAVLKVELVFAPDQYRILRKDLVVFGDNFAIRGRWRSGHNTHRHGNTG